MNMSRVRASGRDVVKSHMKAVQRVPPHSIGEFANPRDRGCSSVGRGWFVASVRVRASANTIGPHSETPQSRPPSRRGGFFEVGFGTLLIDLRDPRTAPVRPANNQTLHPDSHLPFSSPRSALGFAWYNSSRSCHFQLFIIMKSLLKSHF